MYILCTGMFPYVCVAMIPVFCDPATVSKVLRSVTERNRNKKSKLKSNDYKTPTSIKQNAIAAFVCTYTALQLFLPYSHFVTQVSKKCSKSSYRHYIKYHFRVFTGLQRTSKRIIRILLGHDGIQRRRGKDSCQSGGPRTPRAVLLRSTRNNIYIQYNIHNMHTYITYSYIMQFHRN